MLGAGGWGELRGRVGLSRSVQQYVELVAMVTTDALECVTVCNRCREMGVIPRY